MTPDMQGGVIGLRVLVSYLSSGLLVSMIAFANARLHNTKRNSESCIPLKVGIFGV